MIFDFRVMVSNYEMNQNRVLYLKMLELDDIFLTTNRKGIRYNVPLCSMNIKFVMTM